jgi:hypothetical protein
MTNNLRTEFDRQLALAREEARAEVEHRAREAEARRIEAQEVEEARAGAREERFAARKLLLSEFLFGIKQLTKLVYLRKQDQPSIDDGMWTIAVEGPRPIEQHILITSSDDVAHLGITFLPDQTFSSIGELRAYLYGDLLARIALAVAYHEAEVQATERAGTLAAGTVTTSADDVECADNPEHVSEPAVTTVGQFAQVLHVPAERLIEQLRDAGLGGFGVDDVVTDELKLDLLIYLRRKHGRSEP